MNRSVFTILLSFALSILGVAAAQVGPAVKTDYATTRLVSEFTAAAPGQKITLALVQELEEGWHVYWRNPGDSGLPLTLDWTLPDGAVADAPLYPLPHKLSFGPLTNYGHEGAPVFLIPFTVPQNAVPGEILPLTVRADWLICKEQCVPEFAELRLILPIVEGGTDRTPTAGFADKVAVARAEQPTPASFDASYYVSDRGPVLVLDGAPSKEIEFYPYAPSLIEPSAEVIVTRDGDVQYLEFKSGFAFEASPPNRLAGVLVEGHGADIRGYELFAPKVPAPVAAPTAAEPTKTAPASVFGISTVIFAFLGGLILNLMPCVFPIVFLKAAGFATIPREERGTIRRHGLLYTAGVLVAFAGLAGLLLALRSAGAQLGWGFQLQSPIAVGAFALIIFLIGLNLAGVFEAFTSAQGVGQGLAAKGGDAGAFFTGLLAVAVAAPCVGPFLGAAIGVALGQSAAMAILIFLVIGLGLAFPYLLISLMPVFARALPKPGPWMETLKQLFAFAMFGTLVWLAWVLSLQAGSPGTLALGISLVLAAMAAWLFGRAQRGQSGTLAKVAALLALVGAIAPITQLTVAAAPAIGQSESGGVVTMPYDERSLSDLRAEGTPVFVDFTAAWCITCQVNKRTVIKTDPVQEAFAANKVVYMVADWTTQDPAITRALAAQGRAGVPLYLYYGPGAVAPEVLPAVLTKQMVLDLIEM